MKDLIGVTAALNAVKGNRSELARRLNISAQSVQLWVAKDEIPLKRVIEVEKVTGVPRHILAPDMYSDSESKVAA
tara:strand:- start:635 stop:859 length:225 start_codon:yes stop_codon:yes gene_type:complete